ncbi:MAG TPA: hypothetical protein DCZ75_15385 [Geobacter sp.]|nr:hypothetical protein [Geobacter sp.]
MSDTENQMGLFETSEPLPALAVTAPKPAPAAAAKASPKKPAARPQPPASAPKDTRTAAPRFRKSQATPDTKGASGLVPVGDVRLTANIRQDLHLKLKIASAHRRTTIGEILEELIERYV